jgi:hypothetical protein
LDNNKYIVKTGNQILGAVREEEYTKPKSHFYLKFDKAPLSGVNTDMSFVLVDFFLKSIGQSRKSWKKDNKTYKITWDNYYTNLIEESKPVNYKILAKHLRENFAYLPKTLNLPDLECLWLDKSVDISINFHKFDKGSNTALSVNDGTPQLQFGDKYPIKPSLDREGHFFTSFHPQLIKRIIKNRNELVENSDKALHYDWVLDLRTIINDTISLVDITLNQFYIKAEYLPEIGWNFNKEIVGERISRRLDDKFKWIRQITGKSFDYEPERESLKRLKEIRNHLNHFDPPSLVITIEEVANWLNDLIVIGLLLVRIRNTVGVPVSTDLINYVLQKKVVFNPEEAFKKRLPLSSERGYYSSVWK